ncbi:MAG: hypothetical protein KDB34_03535, partial [Propionibacteriaceae bacterium]|nr:hypothetical protein [Propionibacteriaceae bacterium]
GAVRRRARRRDHRLRHDRGTMNATRTIALTSGIAAVVTATALLTGCTPTSTAPSPAPNGTGVMFEHIHELVPDPSDGSLLVATHEGLYRLTIGSDGSAAADGPIGGLDFDPMGFTVADGIAYASGHPGPTTPDTFGNPNLGLITSTDLGRSWTNVSLTGVTDFHGLTVAPSGGDVRVFGYDGSRQRIVTSFDGGASWVDGAELAARDILAVGDLLYATTADGLAISSDDGKTFTIDAGAPALYLVAADTSGA